jgi:hypothetical protein
MLRWWTTGEHIQRSMVFEQPGTRPWPICFCTWVSMHRFPSRLKQFILCDDQVMMRRSLLGCGRNNLVSISVLAPIILALDPPLSATGPKNFTNRDDERLVIRCNRLKLGHIPRAMTCLTEGFKSNLGDSTPAKLYLDGGATTTAWADRREPS